jgi:hypothetical protein
MASAKLSVTSFASEEDGRMTAHALVGGRFNNISTSRPLEVAYRTRVGAQSTAGSREARSFLHVGCGRCGVPYIL